MASEPLAKGERKGKGERIMRWKKGEGEGASKTANGEGEEG